jgi:hypothetical protein
MLNTKTPSTVLIRIHIAFNQTEHPYTYYVPYSRNLRLKHENKCQEVY